MREELELTVLEGGQSELKKVSMQNNIHSLKREYDDLPNPQDITKKEKVEAIKKAKIQGYEGEACGECGNFTLVRNGTCMKCNTCGSTSGCS